MCGRIAQGRSAQALAPIYPGLLFTDAAALPEGDLRHRRRGVGDGDVHRSGDGR